MELVQIRLLVHDFGACFRFYRDVLGLHPQVDDERGPYAKFSLETGQCAIALQSRAHFAATFAQLHAAETRASDATLLALKVADIDACCRQLSARGATLVQTPTSQWERLRVAYLRDPEGNLIELQQWLANVSETSATE